MWFRAAALFYPRARRSPGARRGPRPWATPRGEAAGLSTCTVSVDGFVALTCARVTPFRCGRSRGRKCGDGGGLIRRLCTARRCRSDHCVSHLGSPLCGCEIHVCVVFNSWCQYQAAAAAAAAVQPVIHCTGPGAGTTDTGTGTGERCRYRLRYRCRHRYRTEHHDEGALLHNRTWTGWCCRGQATTALSANGPVARGDHQGAQREREASWLHHWQDASTSS